MSHNIGRIVPVAGFRVGPDTGDAPSPAGTWERTFSPQPALAGGTPRFVILHFTAMDLPGTSRVEVDLGYGQDDLLRFEGEYTFHAVATSDDGCAARREVMWSLHVDPGIDPGRTDVRLVASADGSGSIRMTPSDRYGNPLGPGRSPLFDVTGQPGTQVTGPVVDNGDGSYAVPVSWDPGAPGGPGIVVSQPERDPVPIAPSAVSGVDRLRWLPWVLLALVIALVIVILIVLLVS